MDFLGRVYDWFTDGDHWSGNSGIPNRLIEHLQLTIVAMVIAMVIALPIGLILGHTRRGGNVAVNISNVGRAIPSFALLVLGAQLWGIGEIEGMSKAALLALVALAIPPIIVNSYVGMSQVDEGIRDSATGVGMRSSQRLLRVEPPHRAAARDGRHPHLRAPGRRDSDARCGGRVRRSRPIHRRRHRGTRLPPCLRRRAARGHTRTHDRSRARTRAARHGVRRVAGRGPAPVRQPGLDAPGSLHLVGAGSIPNREETP